MFLTNDVLEFINKIINQSDVSQKELVKENIMKFRKYLELTQMADKVTLANIDVIVDCLDELMTLKNKLGNVDVTEIFKGREESVDKKRKLESNGQSVYDNKHYKHYQRDISSNCGNGSVTRNSSCQSSSVSYSSSCGCNLSYRNC